MQREETTERIAAHLTAPQRRAIREAHGATYCAPHPQTAAALRRRGLVRGRSEALTLTLVGEYVAAHLFGPSDRLWQIDLVARTEARERAMNEARASEAILKKRGI
ncbi:MAG: hypothetical protein KC620_09820 [Myxococcales bacterium]|nr:hypothetical protein [Myxococcales bacterium]